MDCGRCGWFAAEINEITATVKSDITALNTALDELQILRSEQRQNSQSSEHTATVVGTLKGNSACVCINHASMEKESFQREDPIALVRCPWLPPSFALTFFGLLVAWQASF